MSGGILVCGLNGAGKSTLGRALAQKLGWAFFDSEDLFFPKADPEHPFRHPRSREEAAALLRQGAALHRDFVYAAVRGDLVPVELFRLAVLVRAPRALRLERVRRRSQHLPGEGDFLRMVDQRPEDWVESWLEGVPLPVLQVDGARPLEETLDWLVPRLGRGAG